MKKKTITAAILALLILTGCSNAVRYTVSPRFDTVAPHTMAILPVEWGPDAGEQINDVAYLFRTMTLEKIKGLSYRPVPLEEVDEKYLKLGRDYFRKSPPEEAARVLGADSVLFTRITEWENDIYVTYARVRLEAKFELFSKDGVKLWEASYDIGDSDIRLDTESMELAMIKSYEPRVQRFIDFVFATLPRGVPPAEDKRYFDWLP